MIRYCSEPGCPRLAEKGGRCRSHARANSRLYGKRGMYSTKRWAILRRRVILEEPICRSCKQELSSHVDHILAVEDGGEPWDRENLQGLCPGCHSSKTRQETMARDNRG